AEIGSISTWWSRMPGPGPVALALALGIGAFDLWHLAFAAHGAPPLVQSMLGGQWPAAWKAVHPTAFASSQIQIAVRYFTRTGLIAAVLAAGALLNARAAAALGLADAREPALVERLLAISGGAACAYVLAAPSWAQVHAYWQFYALPFVVTSMILLWRA